MTRHPWILLVLGLVPGALACHRERKTPSPEVAAPVSVMPRHPEATATYNRLRPRFRCRVPGGEHGVLWHQAFLDPMTMPPTAALQVWIEDGALVCAVALPGGDGNALRGLVLRAGRDSLRVPGKAAADPDGVRLLLNEQDGAAALRFIAEHPHGPVRLALEGAGRVHFALPTEHQSAVVESAQLQGALRVLTDGGGPKPAP